MKDAPYVSVTITVDEVETVYSNDGNSYVDIILDNKVLLISHENKKYLVDSSTYDAETSSYTAETYTGETIIIKIVELEGIKTIEVTIVSETNEDNGTKEN